MSLIHPSKTINYMMGKPKGNDSGMAYRYFQWIVRSPEIGGENKKTYQQVKKGGSRCCCPVQTDCSSWSREVLACLLKIYLFITKLIQEYGKALYHRQWSMSLIPHAHGGLGKYNRVLSSLSSSVQKSQMKRRSMAKLSYVVDAMMKLSRSLTSWCLLQLFRLPSLIFKVLSHHELIFWSPLFRSYFTTIFFIYRRTETSMNGWCEQR